MLSQSRFQKSPFSRKAFIPSIAMIMLSACTLKPTVAPDGDGLSDATVGRPYRADITITGGAVYSIDSHGRDKFVGDIAPKNSGLSLRYCNNSPAHNCVRVSGVPVAPGITKVRVSGGLFGTNVATGGQFDKIYTITIKGA